MGLPWMTVGAVADVWKQGNGRDRGPTRQAKGGEASGQPGSEIPVKSAENEPTLLRPGLGARAKRLLM